MMLDKFPKAEPIKPLFNIGGSIWRRVPAAEALHNPDAIRAAVKIESGPDKGGMKVCWFIKLDEK